MTISDLIPGIKRKLRDRQDLDLFIPQYCRAAILDLTQNYEFDELRHKGPPRNFIQNVSEYPRDFFTQPGHGYCTFIVSWFVYFSTTVAIGNSTGYVLKYRQPRVVEGMSVIHGIPVCYTQVGEQSNSGNLIVGYLPDQAYATYMRYQRQHPFPDISNVAEDQIAFLLASQKIYMPDDWQEIVEYAAAEKACDDVGMNEIGILYHQKLYGNPAKSTVGIITERMSQQQRQSDYNERQLRLQVRRII